MLTKVLTLSLAALLFILGEHGFDYIARKNNAKARAEAAFMSSDYKEAAKWLVYMRSELDVEDPAATLNLGHAYFLQQDSAAVDAYLAVRTGANPPGELASISLQQLAVLEMQRQVQPDKAKAQLENAVAQSREALRQDYTNERARFNYELLKRLLDAANEKEQQNQQNKDQKKQEEEEKKKEQEQQKQEQEQQEKEKEQQKQQQQEQQEGKEGEEKKQKPSEAGEKDEEKKQKEREQQINQRLRKLNLSREKAEQLLEAMRNQEIQYLQQNRKRSKNQNNKNLPDW